MVNKEQCVSELAPGDLRLRRRRASEIIQASRPASPAPVLRLKNRQTLAVWRCTKRYALPYVRCGSRILYKRSDLENFIAASRVVEAAK